MEKIRVSLDSNMSYSISEVISFLKSSYRSEDFVLAEVILRAREKKMVMENEALEVQMKKCLEELRRKEASVGGVELGRELEVWRNKCRDLGLELEKKKMECGVLKGQLGEMENGKIGLEDELKECRRICSELEERVTRIEEERGVIAEREKRAQERIVDLSEELEELEMSEKAKYEELMIVNRDLECGKRRAEDEIEVWKKRVRDLEGRLSGLGGELSVLRCSETDFPGVMEVEIGGLLEDVPYRDEARVARMNQSVSNGGTSDTRLIKNDKIPATATARPVEDIGGPRNAGSPINIQCNPLNDKEEKMDNTPTDLGYGCIIKKQLDFSSGCSDRERLYPELNDQIKSPAGIIEIIDSDEEVEMVARSTANMRGGGLAHILTDDAPIRPPDNEEKHSSGKCLKQLCAERSHDEDGSSGKENLMRSTSKRRRRIITSESESENEDDDRVPISKLKMKKLEQEEEKVGNSSRSLLNLNSQALACRDDNAEEPTSPTRRRLISLRQCEEKNCRTERACPEITSLKHIEMNGPSYKKQGDPASENYKENLVEEVGLGGIENDPETSDSTDISSCSSEETDNNLSFGPILALLRRKRDMKAKWEFEADMLSSFEENPELCMKAVCALYRQQTSEEKLAKGSLHHNNRGFSKFDALRGTTLAEFLTDGDPKSDVKKSIEELKVFDRKGLEDCKRLARHYSKQLFSIYQNKEDPFFQT